MSKPSKLGIWIKRLSMIFGAVALMAVMKSLSIIHGTELPDDYFYGGMPTIMPILNSEWFMGFVFAVTVGVFIYVLYLLWELHEIPVHKVQRENRLVIDLVFGLSLAGLFIDKKWWVLAIIVAFTPWRALAEGLGRAVRGEPEKSATTTDSDKE